jgi:hypothetical protein
MVDFWQITAHDGATLAGEALVVGGDVSHVGIWPSTCAVYLLLCKRWPTIELRSTANPVSGRRRHCEVLVVVVEI